MIRCMRASLLVMILSVGTMVNEAVAQSVERLGSPFELNDIRGVDVILQEFVQRIATNPGAAAQFGTSSTLLGFLQSSRDAIFNAIQGRQNETRATGAGIIEVLDDLAETARTSGTTIISAPNLATLTSQTAILFARIAFEGKKFAPRPQAPGKSAPYAQAPPKSAPTPQAPPTSRPSYGPIHSPLPQMQAPGKNFPMPIAPGKFLPSPQQ